MDFTVHDLGEGWVMCYLEPCNVLLSSINMGNMSGNTVYWMSLVLLLIGYSSVRECIVSLQHLHYYLELFGVVLHNCKHSNSVKCYCVFHIVTSLYKLGQFLYL